MATANTVGVRSYASGVSTCPLLGETIGHALARVAAKHAGRTALVEMSTGRRWTYQRLIEDVDRVAAELLRAGVEVGDRVAVWSPNCAEWTLVQFATARVGAILVTVNPAYRDHELQFVMRQSASRLLFSADSFKSSDYRATIERVRSSLPDLKRVVYFGTEDWAAFEAELDPPRVAAIADRSAKLSFDDPINIQYTSGTTGFPKGATLTHHNILNNGYFVGERCGYTEHDVICVPVPFYHCFGMVLGAIGAFSHGAAMVIPSPSFDAEATLAAVQVQNCTSLYGVPTMFIAELELENFSSFDLRSLRTGIMAGSPCPIAIMKRVINDMGCAGITICYGMTETSPVSTQTLPDDDVDKRTATVGKVHPHVEIKIIDPESGIVVPRGTPGELCTRGYSVMRGYWNDTEQTSEMIDAARWMHSGDLAIMSDDGYVSVAGRIKDMVIRGGENIYPREIEEFLHTHPDIQGAQVVGVPDAKYGEELCAWIQVRQGSALDQEGVQEFCRQSLAHHKAPKYVLFVEAFPMTSTGKIQKYKMREQSLKRLALHSG